MKKRVSLKIMCHLLGGICELYDDEVIELTQKDDQDPNELRKMIREYIVPRFEDYDDRSQAIMKESLEYYLVTKASEVDRILPFCQAPIDPPCQRDFLLLIWDELFHTTPPDNIDLSDYIEDESDDFVNSLSFREFK